MPRCAVGESDSAPTQTVQQAGTAVLVIESKYQPLFRVLVLRGRPIGFRI